MPGNADIENVLKKLHPVSKGITIKDDSGIDERTIIISKVIGDSSYEIPLR